MTKSGEVKKRSRKTEAVAMALCIPEKNRQSNVPCTLWDEDRENVVECRYGQLSSTEEIEKKKQKKLGTIQSKIIGRAKVAQL